MSEIQTSLDALEPSLSHFEMEAKFSGKDDDKDSYLAVHAGAGGTESHWWVQKLSSAYQRYAEGKGWSVEEVSVSHGSVDGFKSITLKIKGKRAFGHLKAETGVHRFCRVSPYDSSDRVHTSFVSVDVIPSSEKEGEDEIEINENDVTMTTFKSSGPGGQHANKADSAVRLTHDPTGLIVECQSTRSQHQNKRKAYALLEARLGQAKEEERKKERQESYQEKNQSSFGHQIRSYELHQGSYVKDHRTDFVEQQPDRVLDDGEFDDLIESFLVMK